MSIAHAPLSDEAAMGLALAQAHAAQNAGEVPVGAVVSVYLLLQAFYKHK